MQIDCRQCSAEIPAENVNLNRLVAKCSECNSVFSIADRFADADGYQHFERIDVPMPKGFEVEGLGGELQITRRWFSPQLIVLTVFALFWNGFMAVWFGIAISQRIWLMALFGIVHAMVGIGLAYYVLAGYFNTTLVRVGMGELSISQGPFPYPGNKRLDSVSIKQLYCKERSHRGEDLTGWSYELHIVTTDGKHEKLLTGLDESEQALYLEQEIERYLGIEDRPVRGELGR
jgi:hypothetical protein